MKTQDWLRNNGGNLELLEEQLGIKSNRHEDGRVILNYSQIDSPKNNEIVRECRGLVLDSNNDWALVARAFPRFFNVGEFPQEFEEFNWDACGAWHKEDGSLLLVYYWNYEWRINTRNSFGEGEINYAGLTWKELALQAIPQSFFDKAHAGYTYVFELCSPHNKIVRTYDEPQVFLLTVFDTIRNKEVRAFHERYEMCGNLGVKSPKYLHFQCEAHAENYIREMAEDDPTFEGVVLLDEFTGKRWKIKSPAYLALHRMANNGDPCHPKNLIPFIISGELDELYSYFPEVRPFVEKMNQYIAREFANIDNYWYCFKDEPSQKKFALAIAECRHTGILFKARKLGVEPASLFVTLEYLTKMFKGFQYD